MERYFKGLDVNTQAEVVESVVLGSIDLQDASDMIAHDLFGCGVWELKDQSKTFICNKLATWINGKYRCNLQ